MFKKLFKEKEATPITMVEQVLLQLLEKGGFSLSIELTEDKKTGEIFVDMFGEDEGLLKAKEGRLILAFQVFLNRMLRHQFSTEDVFVRVDSGGFFEEKDQRLLDLAERLKKKALQTGRPVYFKKPLSPFQRRKVHQLLTEGGEVETISKGDGFYKNICIQPANQKA